MKKFIEEFKAFAMRGNVLDMAVGVVIGGAFGKITTSLVNDIIMPVVSLLTNGIDFSQWKLVLSRLWSPPPVRCRPPRSPSTSAT